MADDPLNAAVPEDGSTASPLDQTAPFSEGDWNMIERWRIEQQKIEQNDDPATDLFYNTEDVARREEARGGRYANTYWENFYEGAKAGFLDDTFAVGAYNWWNRGTFDDDPNFDPDQHPELFEGLPWDMQDDIYMAGSLAEAQALRSEVDDYVSRASGMAFGGSGSLSGRLAGGLLDLDAPLMFVPYGGQLYKGGRLSIMAKQASHAAALSAGLSAGSVATRPTGDWSEVPLAGFTGLALGGIAGYLSRPSTPRLPESIPETARELQAIDTKYTEGLQQAVDDFGEIGEHSNNWADVNTGKQALNPRDPDEVQQPWSRGPDDPSDTKPTTDEIVENNRAKAEYEAEKAEIEAEKKAQPAVVGGSPRDRAKRPERQPTKPDPGPRLDRDGQPIPEGAIVIEGARRLDLMDVAKILMDDDRVDIRLLTDEEMREPFKGTRHEGVSIGGYVQPKDRYWSPVTQEWEVSKVVYALNKDLFNDPKRGDALFNPNYSGRATQGQYVAFHEFGHILHQDPKAFKAWDDARALSQEMKDELAEMIRVSRYWMFDDQGKLLDEQAGYADAPHEMYADAVSLYGMSPVNFNARFPVLAKAIRASMRQSSFNRSKLVFNSILAAGLGVGAAAASGQQFAADGGLSA